MFQIVLAACLFHFMMYTAHWSQRQLFILFVHLGKYALKTFMMLSIVFGMLTNPQLKMSIFKTHKSIYLIRNNNNNVVTRCQWTQIVLIDCFFKKIVGRLNFFNLKTGRHKNVQTFYTLPLVCICIIWLTVKVVSWVFGWTGKFS